MKRTLKAAYMAILIIVMCIAAPFALANTQGNAPSPEQNLNTTVNTSDAQSGELINWDLTDTPSFIERASVRDTYEYGTVYEDDFALVYIPNKLTDKITFGFFFPGNNYGHTLPDDNVSEVCDIYKPLSVYVFSKESCLATLNKEDGVLWRCGEIIKEVCKDFNATPKKAGVVGYSNGGYTALHVAAYLIDEFHIDVPRVVILDMGQQWGKMEFLISEEDAQPMINAGTNVYHFTRHGETGNIRGSRQFASYGVPLYEIACVRGSHQDILSNGLYLGVIFWAVGDFSLMKLSDLYGEPELVNEDAVNSHMSIVETEGNIASQ